MYKEIKYLSIAAIIPGIIVFGLILFSFDSKTMHKTALASQTFPTVHSNYLDKATGWLNSKPLKTTDLKGKVVLINFCTYTCINWLRTLPYVRSWSEKYKSKGLLVIGIHTPEFVFERKYDNVRNAISHMKISYPVALDNDRGIWDAFNNQYWPALYFIDAKGNIRHHQFGEGNYENSETIIRQLLKEAGDNTVYGEITHVNGQGIEVAPDWDNLKSVENYLGYERTENFSTPASVQIEKSSVYTIPEKLRLNYWAVSGSWTMKKYSIVLNRSSGRLVYRFHSRDLHIVMGPEIPGVPIKFRVLIDGRAPGADHGTDIDTEGYGSITEYRLYQLIRQQHVNADREFEIEFLNPGVEAFSFTFG